MIYDKDNNQVVDGEVVWANQPDGSPWTAAAADEFITATLVERASYRQMAAMSKHALVITHIASDAATMAQTAVQPDLREVTCPVGAVLSINAELRSPDGLRVPLDSTFRLPIRARDGREKLLLAVMQDGQATISAPMRESGVWGVTADLINSSLPPETQMSFDGVEVFVFDA